MDSSKKFSGVNIPDYSFNDINMDCGPVNSNDPDGDKAFIRINWSSPELGFGMVTMTFNIYGELTDIDTEAMGKQFVLNLMDAMIDDKP